MKNILTGILLTVTPLCAFAQKDSSSGASLSKTQLKNNMFADIGISEWPLKHLPSSSFTYSWKTRKHFGLGAGIQGSNFTLVRPHNLSRNVYVPTIYADLRWYMPAGKSLFFTLIDLGVNFYQNTSAVYRSTIYESQNDGFYTGLGAGYCYRINARGDGPYMSLKLAFNTHPSKETDMITRKVYEVMDLDGRFVLAVGYKF